MPTNAPTRRKPSAPLFWSLAALTVVTPPLNLYNAPRSPDDKPFWMLLAILAWILMYLGLGGAIWGRYRGRA